MRQRTHRRGHDAGNTQKGILGREHTEGDVRQRTHRRGREAENTQKGI
jgi:hypothetical protein